MSFMGTCDRCGGDGLHTGVGHPHSNAMINLGVVNSWGDNLDAYTIQFIDSTRLIMIRDPGKEWVISSIIITPRSVVFTVEEPCEDCKQTQLLTGSLCHTHRPPVPMLGPYER